MYITISRNETVALEGSVSAGGVSSSTSVQGNTAGDRGDGLYVKIANRTPTGVVGITVVDFDSDSIYYNAKSNGTLTPGDGASHRCTYNAGCY